MAKTSTRPVDATVHYTCSPTDVPVGTLTRVLFGMSLQAFAAELSANKDGAWDEVYKKE